MALFHVTTMGNVSFADKNARFEPANVPLQNEILIAKVCDQTGRIVNAEIGKNGNARVIGSQEDASAFASVYSQGMTAYSTATPHVGLAFGKAARDNVIGMTFGHSAIMGQPKPANFTSAPTPMVA